MPIEVITTSKGVAALAQKLKGATRIGYDLEFSPLNPHDNSRLFLISITYKGVAYVIDYTLVRDVAPLLPILQDKRILKIGQNITIDYKFTWHHLGVKLENCYCTYLAEYVITAGLEVPKIKYKDHNGHIKESAFSLGAILWRRYGIALDKQTRDVFINYSGAPFTQDAYEYAAKDTLYLEQLYEDQQVEIKAKGLERTIKVEMRLLPYTALMEYHGVPFDYDRCVAGIPVTEQIIARIDKWLQDLVIAQGLATCVTFSGDTYTACNFGSWQQVLAVFNALDINVTKTDKDALKEWDFKHGLKWNEQHAQESVWIDDDQTEDFDIAYVNAVLRHYAVAKLLSKFKSTYLESLRDKYHAPTGKVYPSFLQLGARATGRYSSAGPNFQNLIKPKSLQAIGLGDYDVRSMIYAPPGYKLVQLDYEGIELVLLAIIAGDAKLQQAILSDDTHKVVTGLIARSFGFAELPEGYKKKHPFDIFRDCAKTKTYARIYGSGVPNVHRKLSIPLALAGYRLERKHVQDWFDEWAREFPLAAHELEKAANDAVSKGYVETILGRRRQWNLAELAQDEKKFWGAKREGANSKIQGSAADLMKVALIRSCERLDLERAMLIMQVHDEAVYLAREDYAEECGIIAQREMIQAGVLLFGEVAHGLIKTDPMILDRYTK